MLAFRRPPQSYAAEPADTPHMRAQQAWDRRMGTAVQAAVTWRWVAICLGALSVALALGMTMVALQKRTFVHVVEVSPQGAVLSVRPAGGDYTPTDAQVSYFLGHFVKLVRGVPTDGVVLRENWLDAYKYLTPAAAARLTEMARSDDPFMSLGRVGRTVHIRSIIARSDHTWEVSWIERSTNETGTPEPQLYTGVFTATTRAPRNADEIASNPLGLFITDFSWSRER